MQTFQVYQVDSLDESSTCDNLYFKKQVHYWDKYRIKDSNAQCRYSDPVVKNGNSWILITQKMARNSIMFTDQLSIENPAQGIQVRYDQEAFESLWQSTLHKVVLPWTLDSGFKTGSTDKIIHFKFGDPNRSAMIWGMQFMKMQIEMIGGISSVKLGYKYYKDLEGSAYSSLQNPAQLQDGFWDFQITSSDLDDNGLIFFKDPADNQKPLSFVASEVKLKMSSGMVNFDFIGMIYDFQVAASGKFPDNSNDNFHNLRFGDFWLTGSLCSKSYFNFKSLFSAGRSEHDINTQDKTSAQNSCHSKCAQSSANAFSGLRYSTGMFKCTCLDNSFSDVFFEVIFSTKNCLIINLTLEQ